MTTNHAVSDLVSRIKNASLVKKEYVEMPFSQLNYEICKVLKEAEFINDVKVFKNKGEAWKSLHIDMAYSKDDESKIKDIKVGSKPGLRKYIRAKNIKPVIGGRGALIISTSKGVMEGGKALKKGLGGEILCVVY